MSYISLDVGTSGVKGAVINEKGEILFLTSERYSFSYPEEGYVEISPLRVWNAVRLVLGKIGSQNYPVRLLAVSSIGETMVILDKQDLPLMNGITYLDQRCRDIFYDMDKKYDMLKISYVTGMPSNQMFTLFKYIWLKENRADLMRRADKYFLFGDYIGYMLSGERAIDPSSASRTMFFDSHNLDWSEEIARTLGLPIDQFSKVRKTGTIIGKIRTELAEDTGLPINLKIIMGCHDQAAASLGSGAVLPGDIMAGEGSTESINLIIDRKSISEKLIEKNLCFEPYIEPGLYQTCVGQLMHGTSIRWFIQEFGSDFGVRNLKDIQGKDEYEKAFQGCAGHAGNMFFFPYLSKVNSMDSENNALGGFIGMDISTNRAMMFRALLEGLCFESLKCLNVLSDAGFPIHSVMASGGCSRSELYMQMKADVWGKDIRILTSPEAGVMGLAMICAKADGIFKNYKEAVKSFVKTDKRYRPCKDYGNKFKKYDEISKIIKRL